MFKQFSSSKRTKEKDDSTVDQVNFFFLVKSL